MRAEKSLILASGSPRRQQLLTEAGYRFEVRTVDIAEPQLSGPGLQPADLAEALAYFKARAVADKAGPDKVVLGADTIVALGATVFGKPKDARDAHEMLKTLSHSPHEVITAVAVIDANTGRRRIDFDRTIVTMTPMTDEVIEDYLRTGTWEGKAGAYAIQEGADKFITGLDGSFTNVIGLPMELVQAVLADFGIHPQSKNTPAPV